MSEARVVPPLQTATGATAAQAEVSILQIFLEFLIIGATSFGGVRAVPCTSTAASSRNDIGLTTRNSWSCLLARAFPV